MSAGALWQRVQMAWAMLSGRGRQEIHPGRPREERPRPRGDEPESSKEGFKEEALPWLDAVYRFALRLVEGDRDAAEDLVQETFLRAHRFWDKYERGTNARSWLFTICRNTYLHRKELVRNQRERPAADLDARVEALSAASAFEKRSPDPERESFQALIDDEVVREIDALPEAFKEVLVLSDLGDLKYQEISDVLDIPHSAPSGSSQASEYESGKGGTCMARELSNPEHKLHVVFQHVKPYIAGACEFCVKAFDVKEEVQEAEVRFLSEFEGL